MRADRLCAGERGVAAVKRALGVAATADARLGHASPDAALSTATGNALGATMPTGKSAIVMMDTRRMDRLAGRAMTIKYPQLAFELNRGYACAHGYDFLYLHMSRETCSHPQLGERHPSYCKLAGVAEALHRGYERVAFLDSDAFFQNMSMDLDEIERTYRPNVSRRADVSFAWDRPFSFGPNAGVHFWRNTAWTAQLLTLWWHLPGGAYHLQHDYEQHLLQWNLMHLRHFGSRMQTYQMQSMAAELDARGWPAYKHAVAHVDHGRNFYRLLLMALALLSRIDEAAVKSQLAQITSAVPRNGTGALGPGDDDGRKGGLKWRTANLRSRSLFKVHRLMQRRGDHINGSALGVASSCERTRTLIVPFDPSARAAASLSASTGGSRLDGDGRRADNSAAARERRRRKLMEDALWGMPLQLVNCSRDAAFAAASGRAADAPADSAHWWLRWRDTSGRLGLVVPAGTRPPTNALDFCLRIGPSRAPRQPDFSLAQLWPCGIAATSNLTSAATTRAALLSKQRSRGADGHTGQLTPLQRFKYNLRGPHSAPCLPAPLAAPPRAVRGVRANAYTAAQSLRIS